MIGAIVEIKIVEIGKRAMHVSINRILITYLIAYLECTDPRSRSDFITPQLRFTYYFPPRLVIDTPYHGAWMLRWTTFVDVEVGRSRSSEFTWNCPYKEKVDLCGILWSQSRTGYPVIALIAGSLVIELNLNLIIYHGGKGRYCIFLSTFYRCPQYPYVTYHQITRLPVIYQLYIA